MINENIFQEDKYEYKIIYRKDEIENICRRITETNSESDKYLMLEDLKQLLNSQDEYIFSS
ncbi:MAG: hypothetical protein ACPHY8_05160 [Patescibacteria group bacterium]